MDTPVDFVCRVAEPDYKDKCYGMKETEDWSLEYSSQKILHTSCQILIIQCSHLTKYAS